MGCKHQVSYALLVAHLKLFVTCLRPCPAARHLAFTPRRSWLFESTEIKLFIIHYEL